MKKIATYLLLLCAVIINVYLIFYWEPQNRVISQEVSKETISYSKSASKLDIEKALEQLSSNDRKDFEKIIKKLSTFDRGKIKEYYESSNEEEGIKSIFRLLRKRLTKEDYQRIKKISYSFLDL